MFRQPLFTTDTERLLYELALKRKEGKTPLVEYDKEDVWGDIGDIEALKKAHEETTTAKNKETEPERVEKRIEEMYNEVKEIPDEEMNAKPSKYSYMDKTLPSGKTLKQLAKAVAKEGIVSGVVTGLVYAANGDDFKDGFVNGMVSGTLSGGISGTFDNYIMMAVGEIAGEAVGYLTESYISDSKDTTNKERIYKVAENVVLANI